MENTPTRLSPTAQTVLDSFLATDNVIDDRRYLYTETKALADALRAAADQVGEWDPAEDLRAIAAELERHYDSLYA